MTTIISNIFFKISYRDLHRKTAFHSRLFLGFPKDGINMIWNEKVLIKPLISKINILREFLLCPPPTLLLVRFKPWQQCWRWWQVPQIFVLPRDSTPLRYSSCVIVTVATMSWWWWWLQQQCWWRPCPPSSVWQTSKESRARLVQPRSRKPFQPSPEKSEYDDQHKEPILIDTKII